jgi:hypothetical protein
MIHAMDITDNLVLIAVGVIAILILKEKIPYHNSILTGHQYLNELMETPNHNRFRDVARMNKSCFLNLWQFIRREGGLKDGKKVSSKEKLLSLLYILGNGSSMRNAAERWQHSTSTMSANFRETINCIYNMYEKLIVLPKPAVQPEILNNFKFAAYFSKALGAIDGTHIPAVVPNNKCDVYRLYLNICIIVRVIMFFLEIEKDLYRRMYLHQSTLI